MVMASLIFVTGSLLFHIDIVRRNQMVNTREKFKG